MEYKDYLKQFDQDWKRAESKTYSELPDGKYIVNIETARIEEKDGVIALRFGLRILIGDYVRRLIFKNIRLDKPERFGYLKGDLSKIGFELNELSQLPDLLPSLLDRVMEVTTKTGKPNVEGKTYQNCYFSKFICLLKEFESADLAGIDLNDIPF